MIEMVHGETVIKILDRKLDEMIRKGWEVKADDPVVESEEIILYDDSAEE